MDLGYSLIVPGYRFSTGIRCPPQIEAHVKACKYCGEYHRGLRINCDKCCNFARAVVGGICDSLLNPNLLLACRNTTWLIHGISFASAQSGHRPSPPVIIGWYWSRHTGEGQKNCAEGIQQTNWVSGNLVTTSAFGLFTYRRDLNLSSRAIATAAATRCRPIKLDFYWQVRICARNKLYPTG